MTYIIQKYKGYDVSGGAILNNESGKYFPTLCITKHQDTEGITLDKKFNFRRVEENLFRSVDDAIKAALKHGFSIIDGEVVGQTVNDM